MVFPPRSTANPRTYRVVLVLLVALILLAYALRLVNIDAFSFWTDEGLTPLRSGYAIGEILSNRITIQEGVGRDTHPPLYYLIVHVTQRLFGQSDFAYRYPSLLFGVLLLPLLYQFGRRLQSLGAGLFAALFVAINPLQIYYSDEARMYTLFGFLAAAASYVLWRALSGASVRRTLPVYIILAGLALYTHYTAVFLIAVQALFWLGLLWRQGYKKLILALGLLALLLALPIIPYTWPRLFTGAEASYFYVQPTVMLLDVLRFFSLGLSVDFNQAVVTLFLAAAFLLALVGLWAAGSRLKRFFLLGYLLAVVLGLMAGSLIKPMYQGVRHIMVGSPAFLLLLALGADYLSFALRSRDSQLKWVRGLVGLVLIAAVLAGSFYSLNNFYADPSFAKDDFRSMIRYIEQRAGDNDVVVYHNAILLPLHQHYRTRDDLEVTALPVYPYGADGVEEQLADLAARYDRIWFTVDPPADKRDIEGRVPAWLRENLQDVDNESFHARTTLVHATGYRTAPTAVDALPEDGRELHLAWPNLPALDSISAVPSQVGGGETVWFDLLWAGDQGAPPRGTTLRLWLQGAAGNQWAPYEQALSDNLTGWPTADLVRESYKLPLPQAMPPGQYTLMAQPLGTDGAVVGEAQELAGIEISPSAGLPGRPAMLFENGLALQDIAWFDESIHPGHNMSVALTWQTGSDSSVDTSGLHYEIDVIAPNGDITRTVRGEVGGGQAGLLPRDSAVRDVEAIYFPPDSPLGRYELWWRLYDGERLVGGRPYWRPWSSENVIHGAVEVTPWSLETELPADVTVVEGEFGPAIQLYGYRLGEIRTDALPLTLVWLATAVPAESYVTFVHLLDERGEIVAQIDRLPLAGLRPTSGWREGEVLQDQIVLPLPGDLAPGNYDLNVGVYNPDSGRRLPLTLDGEPVLHDQLTLEHLSLP